MRAGRIPGDAAVPSVVLGKSRPTTNGVCHAQGRNGNCLEYTGGKLAEAATAKRQYHDERFFAWWKAKRKETIAKIRTKGIEIDEKIVIGFHDNPKTRDWDGAARVKQVRDDLRADLHECQSKLSWPRKSVSSTTVGNSLQCQS